MDIQDIMDSLGIQGPMTPEKAQAIKDAIKAILQSRQSVSPGKGGGAGGGNGGGSGGGGAGGLGGSNTELSIDPNLLQPSKKNKPQKNNDLEVEDPDDVLSKVKQNEPNENESEESQEEESGVNGAGSSC